MLEELDIGHHADVLQELISRVSTLEKFQKFAMEGYCGYARPLDGQICRYGYKQYNVHNLKLARFKEIFPASSTGMFKFNNMNLEHSLI